VSFEVGEGEIFGLIGPKGAGEDSRSSTSSRAFTVPARPADLRGDELTQLSPHAIARGGVGRTFQNTEVFRALSALDNVLVGAHATPARRFWPRPWRARVRAEETAAPARALALLERVGLGDVADVPAGSLPLGRQKRLEMARALAGGPRLLLLDEPAGGLNPTETRTLMELIRRLRDELSLTLMVVEHDMELVMGLCERVAVLHYGRKIAEGTPREVAADAAVIEALPGSPDDADLARGR
jgi:ABC-type branched-subunit amino acid transport system ATPase component